MAREGSKADLKEDKRGAKKAGMSLKTWEKSPKDKKLDAKGGKGKKNPFGRK